MDKKPQSPARNTTPAQKTETAAVKAETPKKPNTPSKQKLEELDKMIEKVLDENNKGLQSRSSSVRAVASQGSFQVKNEEEKAPVVPAAATVPVQGGNTIDIESRQFMNMLKCTPVKTISKKVVDRPQTELQRLTYANPAAPVDDKILSMSAKIRSKIQLQLKEQYDESLLKARALPKVPTKYSIPVIQSFVMGKNQPIVGNEAHIKATNNGYARNAMGGFFAH